MAKGFSIRAWLGLDTKQFSKGLKTAQGRMTAFQKGLRATNDVLRGLKFAAVGVTAAGAFSRAVTTVKDFQTQMARVGVISDASEKDLAKLRDTAKTIGETTIFSAAEAAEGLQFLAMAGLDVNESMAALPSTLNLATAGAISLGESADILTNIMAGFGLSVGDATMVADVFAQTSRKSNTNVQELYAGVVKLAPAYSQLGLSVKDAARDMALLANSGVKAEEAGTALTGGLARMLRQPAMVADAFKALGVEISESTIQVDNVVGTIKKLSDAGISATQMSEVFGLHWKSIGAIVSKTDEEIQQITKDIDNASGAAEDMAKNGIGAIDRSIKTFMSVLDSLFIQMGEAGLEGVIASIIDKATDLIRWLKSLSKETIAMHGAMLLLIRSSGQISMFFGTFGKFFSKLPATLRLSTKGIKAFGAAVKASTGYLGAILLAIEGAMLAFELYNSQNKTAQEEEIKRLEKLKTFKENISPRTLSDIQKEIAYNKRLISQYESEMKTLEEKGNTGEKWKEYSKELDNLRIQQELLLAEETARLDESVKRTKEAAKQKAIDQQKIDEDERKRKIAEEEEIQKKLRDRKSKAYEDYLKARSKQREIEGGKVLDFELEILKIQKDRALSNEELIKGERLAILEQYYVDRLKLINKYENQEKKIKTFNQREVDKIDTTKLGKETQESLAIAQDAANKEKKIAEDKKKIYDSVAGAAQSAYSSIGDSATAGLRQSEDAGERFLGEMAKMVTEMMAMLLAQATASAIAGGASSGSGTGPAAIFTTPAFIATLVGGVISAFAAIPKFETGGIVGGTSYSGDNITARVNSGEMILNQNQQANLFKMANGGGGTGGLVEFEIRGDRLYGILQKQNNKRKTF